MLFLSRCTPLFYGATISNVAEAFFIVGLYISFYIPSTQTDATSDVSHSGTDPFFIILTVKSFLGARRDECKHVPSQGCKWGGSLTHIQIK